MHIFFLMNEFLASNLLCLMQTLAIWVPYQILLGYNSGIRMVIPFSYFYS